MQQTATAPPPAGPVRTWQATYPGTADQIRHVRAALRPLLRDCPAADDIILLVDELATNAIVHSRSGHPGGTFTVRLRHVPGDHVRAEVQDDGSTWDGDLARSAKYLHGLYLLLTLSTQCGIDNGPQSRTAWFRIDYLPPPATSSTAPPCPTAEPPPDDSGVPHPSCQPAGPPAMT